MKIITTNENLATFGFFDFIKKRAKEDTQTVKNVQDTVKQGKKVVSDIDDFISDVKKKKEVFDNKYGKYLTKRNLKIAGGLGVGLLGLNVLSGVKNTIDLARGTKNLIFRKKEKTTLDPIVTVGNYNLYRKQRSDKGIKRKI